MIVLHQHKWMMKLMQGISIALESIIDFKTIIVGRSNQTQNHSPASQALIVMFAGDTYKHLSYQVFS